MATLRKALPAPVHGTVIAIEMRDRLQRGLNSVAGRPPAPRRGFVDAW